MRLSKSLSIISGIVLIICIIKFIVFLVYLFIDFLTALAYLPIFEFLVYMAIIDLYNTLEILIKNSNNQSNELQTHYKKIENNTTEINKLKAEIKDLKALLPKKEE